MKTITIEQINKVLENLSEYKLKSKYKRVKFEQPEDYYEEKYQGDNSSRIEVYELGIDDFHLRVERCTDSYGNNEFVNSIKIVTPVKKTIIDFE